LNVELCL